MYQHLLVPVDGHELSHRAAKHSLELARRLGARVTAFVVEPALPVPGMGARAMAIARELQAHGQRSSVHAQQVLARFEQSAAQAGVPFVGVYRLSDDVADAIATAAAELGCDLIVMATHGRGAFGELLFGSQTKGVMARTPLPLLVLH